MQYLHKITMLVNWKLWIARTCECVDGWMDGWMRWMEVRKVLAVSFDSSFVVQIQSWKLLHMITWGETGVYCFILGSTHFVNHFNYQSLCSCSLNQVLWRWAESLPISVSRKVASLVSTLLVLTKWMCKLCVSRWRLLCLMSILCKFTISSPWIIHLSWVPLSACIPPHTPNRPKYRHSMWTY